MGLAVCTAAIKNKEMFTVMNLPLFHENYCAQTFWYGHVLQKAAEKQVKYSETFKKLLHMYEYADTACAYIEHNPEKVSEAHRKAAGKAYAKAMKNMDSWLASIPAPQPILFSLDDEPIII